MRHGTNLLVVAVLLLLFPEAHALQNHGAWHADGAQDVLTAVSKGSVSQLPIGFSTLRTTYCGLETRWATLSIITVRSTTDGAVTETIQWAPANSCACPAVQCPFMNGSSLACQVSCASRQSAVCQCATCQGIGGIVKLSGFNSCRCVSPPPSGSPGGRRR